MNGFLIIFNYLCCTPIPTFPSIVDPRAPLPIDRSIHPPIFPSDPHRNLLSTGEVRALCVGKSRDFPTPNFPTPKNFESFCCTPIPTFLSTGDLRAPLPFVDSILAWRFERSD